MSNTTRIILIVLGALVIISVCIGCGLIYSFQSTNNNLVELQGRVPEARANMNSGVTLLVQKIQAINRILDQTFTAEQQVQLGVAEARSGFDQAASDYNPETGDPLQIMQAAADYLRSINIAVEATPTTNFATLGAQAMRETAEAYNQMITQIADYNGVAKKFNVYRKQLFMPQIVGNIMGFPESYAMYDPGNVSLPTSYDDIIK